MTWTTNPSPSSQHLQGAAWDRLRRRILKRDNRECQLGGPNCLETASQVDHVVPISQGGTDDEDNLASACRQCHMEKSSREAVAARAKRTRRRRRPIHPADVLSGHLETPGA